MDYTAVGFYLGNEKQLIITILCIFKYKLLYSIVIIVAIPIQNYINSYNYYYFYCIISICKLL